MKQTIKDIAIGTFTGLLLAIFLFCGVCEAKTNGLAYSQRDGDMHLTHYGYVKVHGKTYYSHYSKSAMYDKGEVAKNTYRVRGDKMYYFGGDGAMVTKDSRNYPLITFNRNGSVHYIYQPGVMRRYRYNANHHRFQYLHDNGKWEDTGMECWPYGMIDWQW